MYQTQQFTRREHELLELLAGYQTNKELADKMCRSTHTIKNHKENLKKKLGFKHTCQLIGFAVAYMKEHTDGSNGWGGVICLLSDT